MFKRIMNSILSWLFGLLRRQRPDYPEDLYQKRKAEFKRQIDNKKKDE